MALASAVESVKEFVNPEDLTKVPASVEERIKRGQARMRDDYAIREECLSFWRGNQYVYRTATGTALLSQATTSNYEGGGKPRHRVRTTRNLLTDIVAHEVAASTQRVPGYEVNPSTSSPEDQSAATLSAKVARFGYDKWSLRSVTERVVTYAVVADEGFAWPYWDSSIGPYMQDLDEETGLTTIIGEGEIKVRVFGGNEVAWEPGLSFDESPWHAIQQARTLDAVRQIEGFYGVNLKPNATGTDDRKHHPHAQLVLVTEYLERPCLKYPHGRWLTIADDRQICPEQRYPCVDSEGNAVDEPVLHKLAYITDPDSDRDLGLVRHLLDSQRTINDCTNKQLEWKNLALVPQLAIQNGALAKGQRITDEPGQVIHIVGSGDFKWRDVPAIPAELSRLKDEAKEDMARIAAQNDIPSQVESGRGIAALLEKDQSRRASFIGNLADFHSRLMRHCLYLVQRHYTEPRLLQVRGEDGTEPLREFLGAQLRGQADVTVLPGSIEPQTKAAQQQLVMSFAERGWIAPEAAMAAINGGTAEGLVKSYEKDVRRARAVIQKIKDGTFYSDPHRPVFPGEDPGIDPETGAPATSLPGWMPRPIDNIPIHKTVFSDFMKGDDFDRMPEDQQQATTAYYAELLNIEQREAAKQAEQQLALAEGQGMSNAARPTKTPPIPSQAPLDPQN